MYILSMANILTADKWVRLITDAVLTTHASENMALPETQWLQRLENQVSIAALDQESAQFISQLHYLALHYSTWQPLNTWHLTQFSVRQRERERDKLFRVWSCDVPVSCSLESWAALTSFWAWHAAGQADCHWCHEVFRLPSASQHAKQSITSQWARQPS